MSLKIVCLIRPEPALIYFVNRIHDVHPVALAVVEAVPTGKRIMRKYRAEGFGGVKQAVERKLRANLSGEQGKACEKWFGKRWTRLEPSVPQVWVEDVNDATARKRIEEEEADAILDHGTSIVKDEILELAPVALNLHWGLSPYYRGTHCTEWALLNADPFNIGVTVHKLSNKIDGGAVFSQARAEVDPKDTVLSINMQLTHKGTELMIPALDEILVGRELKFTEQDPSEGMLALNRHWSDDLERHMRRLESSGAIKDMLISPAKRKKLPIVER